MGLTTQPKFISLCLFMALNVAVSALVARRKGQQDRDGANQVLLMALMFTLVMGLVLGAVFTVIGLVIRKRKAVQK